MNNFPISLGTKLRIDSRDRLDIKLGLDIGYLVGCQVCTEIFWFTHECLFLDLVLRSDQEICTIGSLRSGRKICILPSTIFNQELFNP